MVVRLEHHLVLLEVLVELVRQLHHQVLRPHLAQEEVEEVALMVN